MKAKQSGWKFVVMDYLLKKQGNLCEICFNHFSELSPPEIDHIKPKSKNGENSLDNLRLIHRPCHIKRHSNSEFFQQAKKNLSLALDPYLNFKQKYELGAILEIKKLVEDNFTQTEIGQKMGMTRRRIGYLLSRFGLNPHDTRDWIIILFDKFHIPNGKNQFNITGMNGHS